jgi:maleate isomerase
MNHRTLLGMLTPSSNTILEAVSTAMVAGLPDVSMHFSRFRVTEISLSEAALGQFEYTPMLDAASLLADAKVEAICWNGTSASWLGFDKDRDLCAAIADRTAIAATSSVLALGEIFRLTGVERFGLVTPYLDEIQQKIIPNFRKEGFECVAERHLDERVNFSFSETSVETLTEMVRQVARTKPHAITILCTNLRGGPLVEQLEQQIGIPIYDSVATAVWGSLRLANANPRQIQGWGRLLRDIP